MRKQRKFEENLKITAISPPKICLACTFFAVDVDDPNGMCALTGREVDLDTANNGIMDSCKIKKRKRKKGKATRIERRNT